MNSYIFSPTTITNNWSPEQNSGEYNPMYQLVYDQQVKLHPIKPPDIHPQPQAQ
jgi:hypothetical protein